ncbi:MAG: M20/M25/M40 family metallo-hydrolase, partial [Chrysiogenales bacterium]
ETDGGEYLRLREAVAVHFPDALMPPSILPGISDSRFFRERGVPAYGFCPLLIPMDHLKMIHGNDEKISAEGLARGCDIYADVVRRLCS